MKIVFASELWLQQLCTTLMTAHKNDCKSSLSFCSAIVLRQAPHNQQGMTVFTPAFCF